MSIGISPQVNLHFHNKNSGFAVNYRLYVYENNTTTPRVCYSDYLGVGSHSQPIIIQPDGKVPGEGLYFDDDYLYTLVLYDENGGYVETVNGVSSNSSNSSNSVQSDWGETDTSLASYILNKPTTITADQINKLANVPSDTNSELAAKVQNSAIGVANGVASLNSDGKVPSSQLSGTVATVQEAYVVGFPPFESDWLSETSGGAPLTPSDSVIYYILSSGSYENKEYRWGGTYFVELSASLALGNTSSTAFQGDFGEVAWEHTFDTTTNPHNISKATINLENVDNTSDSEKPVSNAAQALFNKTVNTSGDQSVSGKKYFSDRITVHDGLSMDSYQFPSGGSSPNPGQVLRFPASGYTLEWGSAASSETVAVACGGHALTAQVVDPTPGSTWDNTLTINKNNSLIDAEVDSGDYFDIDTGIFTAPVDGYYYVQAQANFKTAFTGTTSETTDSRLRTYVQMGSTPYFDSSNYERTYLNRAIGCSSAGIIYMYAGATAYGVVECNVSASYTPTSHSTDPYLYRCSVSFHKIATQGVDGADGADGAQGIEGVQGIQGLRGATGADGEDGINGTNGEKGDTGDTGDAFVYEDFTEAQLEALVGPQGDIGLTGETGPTGEKGDTGEAGSGTNIQVSQVAHGFAVLQPIYCDSNSIWQLAQADNSETLATHIVGEVIDVDNFNATNSGVVYSASHGLTVDDYYFTSDVTAGAMVIGEPSLYSNPMFKVVDVDRVEAFQWRPCITYTSASTTTTRYKLLEEMRLSQNSGETYHTGVTMEAGKNYRVVAYCLLMFDEKRNGGFITNPFNLETLGSSTPWQSFERRYGDSITSAFWITQGYGTIWISDVSSSNPLDVVYRIEELIED